MAPPMKCAPTRVYPTEARVMEEFIRRKPTRRAPIPTRYYF